MMNPSYFGTQVQFRAPQILFGATHVEFPTPRSEISKTCFMSYLILKTSSAGYHDDAPLLVICKLWNCAKQDFFRLQSKRIFFILLSKSKTNATFDGVDNLKVETRKL